MRAPHRVLVGCVTAHSMGWAGQGGCRSWRPSWRPFARPRSRNTHRLSVTGSRCVVCGRSCRRTRLSARSVDQRCRRRGTSQARRIAGLACVVLGAACPAVEQPVVGRWAGRRVFGRKLHPIGQSLVGRAPVLVAAEDDASVVGRVDDDGPPETRPVGHGLDGYLVGHLRRPFFLASACRAWSACASRCSDDALCRRMAVIAAIPTAMSGRVTAASWGAAGCRVGSGRSRCVPTVRCVALRGRCSALIPSFVGILWPSSIVAHR